MTHPESVTATITTPDDKDFTDLTLTIQSVRNYPYAVTTHNLTVNLLHTYFVLAGATPVLVHNCGELNLGSGDTPMADAVNVDLKAAPGVNVAADVGALPFRGGSFNAVHAINPLGFQPVSTETARAMNPGGILTVAASKSNKWRRAGSEAVAEAGFELLSAGGLDPKRAFGVMKRADGGIIPVGTNFETRVCRRL
ncbi:class I SAM-dependent methyltransferase [Kitasatospora sp. NPDC048545]|uniref:class I SAM-dependent methyltransferase n=1 Tax=Kitasatospora sp. NPDC048545 TaxID=3157208 RepID=UPI0033DBC1B7